MLKCGFCEVDITPPLGLPIPGYFQPRPATEVKDELYAKAVVVDDGCRAVAIVVLDAIGLESEEVQLVRSLVFAEAGLLPSCVLVAGTHTHTGGPVYRDRGPDEQAYVDFVVRKAADAVTAAYRCRKTARIGLASGSESGISFNRRYWMKDGTVRTNPGYDNPLVVSPAGPIDPEVTVMRIDAEDGTPLGVVTNFACHPDTLGGSQYSADYPGALSKRLKMRLGEQTVSVFINGACGNINHLDFLGGERPGPDHHLGMGESLAEVVLEARDRAILQERVQVGGESLAVTATVRQATDEEMARAEALDRAALENPEAPPPAADLFFARQLIKLRERNEKSTDVEIQALQIGELAIAAFPNELFVEFGLEVKRNSQFPHTMIAAYANGVNGYVATREAFTQGGYETRLTSRTRLAPDTGEKMVAAALQLIGQLHQG